MDKKDLKIQALLERVSELTTLYENKVADLRVELTLKQHEVDEANRRAAALEAPDASETPEEFGTSTDQ